MSETAANSESRAAHAIVGKSPAIQAVLKIAQRAAADSMPVLLTGETGTGKELLARAIHEWSGRRGAFVVANVGAIPDDLAVSMLAGVRRGAWTDVKEQEGLALAAQGGTLFLDEVGDVSRPVQVALLRMIGIGEVLPVGAARPVRLDARIVAATNKNLREMVRAGLFRDDLYERLAAHHIFVPSLRERGPEDANLLVDHIFNQLRADRPGLRISPEARQWLVAQPLTGNVRELRNLITGGADRTGDDDVITREILEALEERDDLASVFSDVKDIDLQKQIVAVKTVYLARALEVGDGDFAKAARYLRLSIEEFQKLYAEIWGGRSPAATAAISRSTDSPSPASGTEHLAPAVVEAAAEVARHVFAEGRYSEVLGAFEEHFVRAVYEALGQKQAACARALGISRNTLRAKLARFDRRGIPKKSD